jgi:hypothetical protein
VSMSNEKTKENKMNKIENFSQSKIYLNLSLKFYLQLNGLMKIQ